MKSLGALLYAGGNKIAEAAKAPLSVDYFGKRFVVMIANSLIGEAKFRANRLANWVGAETIRADQPEQHKIGKLDFFAGRDESGLLRGGDLPWQYMQGLCDAQLTKDEKFNALTRTLAQLPGNISFVFKADPHLRDKDVVRAAFARAGFVNEGRTTLLYKAEAGQDPLDSLKSDARTKIRKGRRELEFTDMDVDSFFDHYREHLGERQSHFFLNIDREMLKKAVAGENPQAEVIALRRKPDESGKEQPIEAAAIVSTGADGYCKLLRLSFRRAVENEDAPPPHQQALKVLVVEAMQRAANRGLPLDVDGFTPGGNTLYSRFGVFEAVHHDQYKRTTPVAAVSRLTQRVKELTL